MFGRSLTGRLIALATLWTAALLIAGGIGLTSLYRISVFQALDDQLEGVVGALLDATVDSEEGELSVPDPPDLDSRYSQTYSGRYWEVFYVNEKTAGVVPVANSPSLYDQSIELDPELVAAARARIPERVSGVAKGPEGQKLRLRVQAVRVAPATFNDLVLIVAAQDRRPADRDVRHFALAASSWLAAFAVGLLAAVLIQVRWGLAPLFAMRDAVTAVREGERERLDEAAPSELAPLAHELNALIDHNRDLVERARAHVGNLAHALKTPISVLLNESRKEAGPFAEIVRRQTEKMQVQVEHHIKRATAATRGQSLGSRADVRAVIDDLVRTLPRMYPERPIALEARATDDLYFRGERQDLEEMVGNLLDNAFKWARGRVAIASLPGETPGSLSVVVDDDGSGLAPEQRAEVIERGIRLDEAIPGSGLGLAIVHDLARVYGGRLELGDSPLGGLRAALSLPSAAPRRAGGRAP
jgi:signal transduction histidine kinase